MEYILKLFGITDVTCKSIGRRNPYSVVMATFNALKTHRVRCTLASLLQNWAWLALYLGWVVPFHMMMDDVSHKDNTQQHLKLNKANCGIHSPRYVFPVLSLVYFLSL